MTSDVIYKFGSSVRPVVADGERWRLSCVKREGRSLGSFRDCAKSYL